MASYHVATDTAAVDVEERSPRAAALAGAWRIVAPPRRGRPVELAVQVDSNGRTWRYRVQMREVRGGDLRVRCRACR